MAFRDRPISMPIRMAFLLCIMLCFVGCGTRKDPCNSFVVFDNGSCTEYRVEDIRDVAWTDSSGTVHALDSGYVPVRSRDLYDASTGKWRAGAFLDPGPGPDGCRLAITYASFTESPEGKDTVRAGDVSLQGFRLGGENTPEWKLDDACGLTAFPDGQAWMVRTQIKLFSDAEGPRHGHDLTYREGVRWGRERLEWTYHFRFWEVLDR
jgi:hypothetical protein